MKNSFDPFSPSLEKISYQEVREDVVAPEFHHESGEYNELHTFVRESAQEYQEELRDKVQTEQVHRPRENNLEATDWMRSIATSFKKMTPGIDQFSDFSPEAQKAAGSYIRGLYQLPEMARSLLFVEKRLGMPGEREKKQPLDIYSSTHYFRVCSWLKEVLPSLIYTNDNPQLLGVGTHILCDQLIKTCSFLYPNPGEAISQPTTMCGDDSEGKGRTITQIAEIYFKGAVGAAHFVKALQEDKGFQERFSDFNLCYAPASLDAFIKTDFLLMPKDWRNEMYALQLKTNVIPRDDMGQTILLGPPDPMYKRIAGIVKSSTKKGKFKAAKHYADVAAEIRPFERSLDRGVGYLQSDENDDPSWNGIDMRPIFCYSARDRRLNEAGHIPAQSRVEVLREGGENE